MAFCSNCGAAVSEGVKFCPQCGREAGAASPASPPAGASVQATGLTSNVAGALCYLLIPAIMFLAMEPYSRDRFIRFHAFQAIFFAIASFAASLVAATLPILNVILVPLVGLGTVALWLILFLQAYQNKQWKLPVLGDMAEKQV